jgi:hypothetical protein
MFLTYDIMFIFTCVFLYLFELAFAVQVFLLMKISGYQLSSWE